MLLSLYVAKPSDAIKGVTKTETFKVEFNGQSKNPMTGSIVAGFDVEGKINCEDYGLT
jgi:polyisoprenoid-binding protein YceI